VALLFVLQQFGSQLQSCSRGTQIMRHRRQSLRLALQQTFQTNLHAVERTCSARHFRGTILRQGRCIQIGANDISSLRQMIQRGQNAANQHPSNNQRAKAGQQNVEQENIRKQRLGIRQGCPEDCLTTIREIYVNQCINTRQRCDSRLTQHTGLVNPDHTDGSIKPRIQSEPAVQTVGNQLGKLVLFAVCIICDTCLRIHKQKLRFCSGKNFCTIFRRESLGQVNHTNNSVGQIHGLGLNDHTLTVFFVNHHTQYVGQQKDCCQNQQRLSDRKSVV